MNILLTGANGFVGSALLSRLSKNEEISVLACVRNATVSFPPGIHSVLIDDISMYNNWHIALKNVDCVVHTAARVHVMADKETDPLAEYRRINVDATLNLARQAARLGVKRFIFISSIKVNGESTRLGVPYTSFDVPAPMDPYAVSKQEAEDGLQQLAIETGMEVVIIRPPLVYGLGVKANFLNVMRWLHKGIPLPLGSIHNKRSLVALDNIIDLIVTCIDHPAAANQVFLVSDGEDLSTTELLHRMGRALEKPARLIPVPQKMLEFSAALLGKGEIAQRLCGSLQVDISRTRQLLGWRPPVSVDVGLRKTAEGFLNSHAK